MITSSINPHVSVDCVVFGFDGEHLNFLAIKQKKTKSTIKEQYALPGDLVFEDEDLDEAAQRVLKELTNLEGIYLKQFHAFGDPNRVRDVKDTDWLSTIREHPNARVITIAYFSLVKMEDYHPHAASFAERVAWLPIKRIPSLAFDHNHIISKAIEALREALVYKNIGFELLPKKFTLSQLQCLHEIILDKKLDKRNFRKSVKKMDNVVPLDEKQKGVDHKPAQLFEYIGPQEDGLE